MQPTNALRRPLRWVTGSALVLGLCATDAVAQHPQAPYLSIVLPEDEILLRAAALRQLAESGAPEALGAVVDALDDPAPLIADTAQLACGVIDTPEAAALLLGRLGLQHGEGHVRLRAAEALGRTSAPYRADLFRTLLPRTDTAECRALLASIEQLALRRQLTGDLDETAQWIQTWIRGKHDDEIRAIALATVTAMSTERGGRYTTSVLSQKAPPQLAASALARCLELMLPVANTKLQESLTSPSPIVRAAALRALDSKGDRESLTWLVDSLAREPRLGLRWRAVEALQYLTGLPLELDVAGWRNAVSALALDWEAAHNQSAVVRGTVTANSLQDFAALEPRSDRWVLVTHFAPTPTEEEAAKPTTRRERILAERQRGSSVAMVTDDDLRKAVAEISNRIQSDALTDVIVAGEQLSRLGGALASHSPARVERAQTFIDERSTSAAGDLYGALLAALDTEGVDRVLLVTRGGPRTGQHVELQLIVDLLLRHVRFRHVAIDVVLVEAAPGTLAPLRRLAAETRGRVLRVESGGTGKR